MKKVAVVILQYNNLEETQKCVASLQQLNWDNIEYRFIIVDNGSRGDCGARTQALYSGIPYMDVLLSRENLGFARGNNLGIQYAQEQFCPDLIAVSNNDIEILDREFFQTLCTIYDAEQFAVCGPDIFSVIKQYHQSPIRIRGYTEAQVVALLSEIDRKLKQLYIIKKLHIYELLRFIKRLLGKGGRADAPGYNTAQYDVVVQGAFFVLSQGYLEVYKEGLYPATFMYMEEDILAYLCNEKQLKICYSPQLKVLHYEGAATAKASKKRVDKYIFELENSKNSAQILLGIMRQNCKGENEK